MSSAPPNRVDARLRELERELEAARASVRDRDFELAAVRKALQRAEQLLDEWRGVAREQEDELVNAEKHLVAAELKAERLEETLASLRSGRGYSLMRFVWRMRRPFKRA